MLVPAVACASLPRHAPGAQWILEPRIEVEEQISDNVTLAPDGQEEGDLVTNVSPGIRVRAVGPRLTLFADAAVQRLLYADNGRFNATNVQAQLDSEAELVEQHLFLEARGAFRQQNASSRGRITASNVFATGNRRDVLTYAIAPVVRGRYRDLALGELRLERNEVRGSGTIQDSEGYSLNASVVSGSRFTRLPWRLVYSGQRIEDDTGVDWFRRIRGEVDYALSRAWTALGSVGYENNDVSGGLGDDETGVTWFLGALWTPTQRTRVRATVGHRFFGTDLGLELSHQSRRTRWSASLSEDVESSRVARFEERPFALVDAFGEPLVDPVSGEQIVGVANVLVPDNETRVNRRVTGAVEFTGRRTTLALRLAADFREFQRSGEDEEVLSAAATLSRRLSPRTTARVDGGWRSTEFRDGREDDFWDLALSVTRRVGRDIELGLTLAHQRQDSTSAADEYRETGASARLRVSF